MNTPVILETYLDTEIAFQNNDGWVNATQMAKPFNKTTKDFLRTQGAQAYIAALENSVRQKCLTVNQGGSATEQGTWMHPDLAMEFARWLSPEFSIWCNHIIRRILSRQSAVHPAGTSPELVAILGHLTTIVTHTILERWSSPPSPPKTANL